MMYDKTKKSTNKRKNQSPNQRPEYRRLPKDQFIEMCKFFNWCDAYTGKPFGYECGKPESKSIEHLQSRKNGGKNVIWNCIPISIAVNQQKDREDLDGDWVKWYKNSPYFSEERLERIYQWIEYSKSKYQTA